jgi:hypothetical protein
LFCVSFVTVAVKVCVPPAGTLAVVGVMLTEITTGGAVMVNFTEADFVPSDTEVAVTVTVAGVGTIVGAV